MRHLPKRLGKGPFGPRREAEDRRPTTDHRSRWGRCRLGGRSSVVGRRSSVPLREGSEATRKKAAGVLADSRRPDAPGRVLGLAAVSVAPDGAGGDALFQHDEAEAPRLLLVLTLV